MRSPINPSKTPTSVKAISMITHNVVFRSKVITALFLSVLGYVPLWGQNLDFAPAKPDGPAKIQSALWELATPGAGKLARAAGVEDTVVVILVPHRGQASASIDTSSMAALGVEVQARSKSLLRVSVPASSLLAVSELPGVGFVRRPFRPQAQQETFSEGGRTARRMIITMRASEAKGSRWPLLTADLQERMTYLETCRRVGGTTIIRAKGYMPVMMSTVRPVPRLSTMWPQKPNSISIRWRI